MAKVIIIGGGPAGVSAGLYIKRAGFDTTIISKGVGALEKAHQIDNYYGMDEPVSGVELHRKGLAQAERLGIEILESEVYGLGFENSLQVIGKDGVHECDAIVLATGSARNVPKIPGIKEFEGRGVSYCAVCDGFFHRGKEVAVLGAGEYALHEAMELVPIVGGVTLLTDGEELSVQVPDSIKVNTAKIREITGGDLLSSVVFEDGSSIEVSGLFVAKGSAGSTDLARKLGIMTEGNKIIVNDEMATNIPGVFSAGDCTGGMLQVAKAVYDGALCASSVINFLRKKPDNIFGI